LVLFTVKPKKFFYVVIRRITIIVAFLFQI